MDAKYFCSFTRKRNEFTKFAPASVAAALALRSRSTFSPIGISNAFFSMGVRQVTSPTPVTGAKTTGSAWIPALALAMLTARAAARATAWGVTSLVAANPQVPSAITRMPTPYDSVLTTF